MEGPENGCEHRVAHNPRVALYWQSTAIATEANKATKEVRGWAGGNCYRAKAARADHESRTQTLTQLEMGGRVNALPSAHAKERREVVR